MSSISPFRYIQVARYFIQRCLEVGPASSRKGKGKAWSPPVPILGGSAGSSILRSAMAQERSSESSTFDHPVAGPSRGGDFSPDPNYPAEPTAIYGLMNDDRLLVPGAIKPPREVVVLCHGLYGFSTATPIPLFPSLKLHYWASVLEVLRDRMGVKVLVVGVKGTGSIEERAQQMHAFLKDKIPRGSGVNFVAHSMGGLDVRHLISNIKPTEYTPLSLTTIGTPHRGSPFMDWCAANIGVGSITAAASAALGAASEAAGSKGIPFSLKSPILARHAKEEVAKSERGFAAFTSALTSYLLNIFDSPAYANLTTAYLRDHFNPRTPDSSSVKYTSVAGRISKMSVLHPLWFPKLVLDAAGERGYPSDWEHAGKAYEGNDGLVSVSSAKWGEFLGAVDHTHHWDLRGEGGLWPNGMSAKEEDKEVKPEQQQKKMPGSWEWGDSKDKKANPTSSSESLSPQASSAKLPDDADLFREAKADLQREKAQTPPGSTSSWELAQVGQVIDWVTDLLPGGKSSETSRKQLADAKREKEKEQGQAMEREKERERRRRDKFALDRFYGGLMIKLREDGF